MGAVGKTEHIDLTPCPLSKDAKVPCVEGIEEEEEEEEGGTLVWVVGVVGKTEHIDLTP